MSQYLGLDSSTQSLSAIVIDTERGEVVHESAVQFGSDLPQFESPHGFLESADSSVRHSNPLMWVAALDTLLDSIKNSGFDLGKIDGISGAGQQHGSVYLNAPVESVRFSGSLMQSVSGLLSRATSPIWMDSSTSTQCQEIAEGAGGDAIVTQISGSRAIERFTGPQIRKCWQTDPKAYEATKEIHLVSSFIASLLIEKSAPIDLGDAAGMNLLDLAKGAFSDTLLDATAPGLAKKLLAPVPSNTKVGRIGPYFVGRFGFRPETPVFAFTGDNPSSLIGLGASAPGTAIISMGTSDTVFAAMREPKTDPNGYGHVFGNPAGGYMSLICFANGSLARERVKDDAGYDWQMFEDAIMRRTSPGNDGNLLLPFFTPEMTPKLHRARAERFGSEDFVQGRNPAALMRAVVEAQALSMQRHSRWIGETPTRLLVTGGASANLGIRQVLADVFQAEIRSLLVKNSSALGGALRAAQAAGGHAWQSLYDRFAAPEKEAVTPGAGTKDAYVALSRSFEQRLSDALARDQ